MATNRELKQALLRKLGVTPQALSQRVQKKKDVAPMSTEDATYLIAHEQGIRLDRYLPQDAVDRIRHLQTTTNQANAAAVAPKRTRAKKSPDSIEIRFPSGFKTSNSLLAKARLNEAVAMAKIYPILYVLENSMRELIKRVMADKYGDNWWDTQLTKGKLKGVLKKAEDRMKSENEKHSWHQRRGDHPVDYVDIKDLEIIVLARQSLFIPAIIPDVEWFKQFMKELYPSRNVVAHMNPLDGDNTKDVELRAKKWAKMLDKAKANIPAKK